jgi:hypothetical protein
MRRAGRQAEVPRQEVPDNGTRQAREDYRERDDIQIDHARANRFRHGCAEAERRDEIEERRPDDGLTGREYSRRHDGGDGIRCIVKPVDVVENQGNQNDARDGIER